MRIGLFTNPDRDPDYRLSRKTAQIISRLGAVAVAEPSARSTALAGDIAVDYADYSTCDLMVCLGGDGTFLSMVHQASSASIPVVGVNLGSVGFLPEIHPDHLEESIQKLISGNYRIEQRMMLGVRCFDSQDELLEEGVALNDAVISRGGSPRILTLELTINQETVDRIPGDGLIISTPTGSTAYSLSAGGPIIHPDLKLMLITPICPHTLHNRSYIASDKSRVVVRICEYPGNAQLAIDGRQDIQLKSGSYVEINKSDKTLKVIRLGHDNFYVSLPQKIEARGRAR